MRSFLTGLLAFVLVSPSTSIARAQRPELELEPGTRVRIFGPTFRNDEPMRIIAVGPDSMQVRADRQSVIYTLALNEITAVEISVGQKRQTLRGMLTGLAVGTTMGTLAGTMAYTPCRRDCWLAPSSRKESATVGAVLGGGTGFVLGTTFGFFSKADTWRRVSLDRRLTIIPGRRGGTVSVANAF